MPRTVRLAVVMRALAASLVAAAAVLLASGTGAQASCAVPPLDDSIRASDVAFVGTVVELANQDRWATVNVEEIWHGPDLAPMVEVRAGPAGDVGSSIDRTYSLGRYLFIVTVAEGALQDTACSATTEWTGDLTQFRPPDARRPSAPVDTAPEPTAGSSPLSPVVVAAAMVVAVVALFASVALLARRRDAAR
jgi:hypothetical protein